MSFADLSIGAPEVPQVAAATGDPDAEWTGAPDVDEVLPEVPEAVVRGILASTGALLAMSPLADPDIDEHWHFSERELDDLTPPLTRVVNARPTLRAAAAHGDHVTIAVQLAGYGGRNLIAGGLARRARNDQPDEWETNGHEYREAQHDPPPGNGGPVVAVGVRPEGGVPGEVGFGIYPPAL